MGGNVLQEQVRSTPVIAAFFAMTFAWSWGLGFAAARVRADVPVMSTALTIAAGFGPSLAALAVVAHFSQGNGLRDWLARCLDWRAGWRWFVFAFLFPPSVMLTAQAIHAMLGGSLPAAPPAGQVPLAILNFALVLLIGGPAGEEFGWRGYAMPALAAHLNWRAANLVTGVIWGLWHVPLFFQPGTVQSLMPVMTFMLNILAGSIVFGWVLARTNGSVLPALVMHTSLNAWAGILGIVPATETARPYGLVTILLVAIALALPMVPVPASWAAARRVAPPPC